MSQTHPLTRQNDFAPRPERVPAHSHGFAVLHGHRLVFATVGFGDITATSQTGRLLVTAQMILDLIVLGLGIRVFLGAVQRGQQDTAQQKTQSR